jgi:pSer/pThr/pTyr-binding forkhead associated (FHA) protein
MPVFVIKHRGALYRVARSETLLGRSEDCPIRLDHAKVSRIHAVLRLTTEALELVDLGSMNGTRVNGQRILGPRKLKLGDVIQIGSEVLDVDLENGGGSSIRVHSTATSPPTTEPFEDAGSALDTLEVVEAMLASSELSERPDEAFRTIRALLDNALTSFAAEGARLDRTTAERIARVAAAVAERAPGTASTRWVDQVAERVQNLLGPPL